MFNPEFEIFNDWMFGKLSALLSDVSPPKDTENILLTIGEPNNHPPEIIKETLNKNLSLIKSKLYYFDIKKDNLTEVIFFLILIHVIN